MPEQPVATILNVNDDDANRYAITWILRKAGFAVAEAATGRDALRRATELPDLIVLDVKLPDLSGFEVCRAIKADPATASIPVLHLSANFVHSRDKAQGLEGGADGYLAQPVEPQELIATVRALLRIRRAEEEARASARQWQATFDAIGDAVCLLDRAGRVVRGNAAMAALVGKPLDQIVGRAHHRLMEEVFGPVEGLDVVAVAGVGRQEVPELRAADRWFRMTADPVLDEQGAVAGVVHVLADITGCKLLEEELRRQAGELAETDRRKDEFLAMLAHELRNPLAPILNAVHVMRLRGDDAPTRERMRDLVEQQVRHMVRLVDDLLDVSRITRGKIQLRREPLDLATVVTRVVEATGPLIEGRGHELTVVLPPEPLRLEADPTRLEQVLVNLLTNAAKYTDPGGSIRLSARGEADKVVVRVRDNGVGIAPQILPHIFDLFAQADRSLDRSQGGLGIGLTLVRLLVERHGGSVQAHSAGLGRGSEFVVRLPGTSAAPPEAPPARAATAESEGFARHVLLVDDNVPSVESLALIVRLWGHEVRVVHSGPEAIEAAQASRPDVVLLDIGLPGMDGYEVARRLRDLPGQEDVLLVAVTGYGQEEDRRRSRLAGFDRHLVKPLDFGVLEGLLAHPGPSRQQTFRLPAR